MPCHRAWQLLSAGHSHCQPQSCGAVELVRYSGAVPWCSYLTKVKCTTWNEAHLERSQAQANNWSTESYSEQPWAQEEFPKLLYDFPPKWEAKLTCRELKKIPNGWTPSGDFDNRKIKWWNGVEQATRASVAYHLINNT